MCLQNINMIWLFRWRLQNLPYYKSLFLSNEIFIVNESILHNWKDDLDSKVDNLHSTDDGEPSEESHGASNSWQHVHKLGCSVLGDSVKCGDIKINPHKSQIQFQLIF